MLCSILLALTISSLLVSPGTTDVIDDSIDTVKDGYQRVKDTVKGVTNTQDDEQANMNSPGVVSCWECTIEKSMDNVVISKHDEKEHSAITGATCKNHPCQANEDWCLVTYYRILSGDNGMESKRERHECGNRDFRDKDTRCQQLLMDDKGHNKIVPRSCKTERSDSSSIHSLYSISLSALLSLLSLLILH